MDSPYILGTVCEDTTTGMWLAWLQLVLRGASFCVSVSSPEDSQAEGPQHQGLAEVQLGPLAHEVLASKDDCSVEAAEHEGLAPGDEQQQQQDTTRQPS